MGWWRSGRVRILAGHAILQNFIPSRKITDLHGFLERQNEYSGVGSFDGSGVATTTCGRLLQADKLRSLLHCSRKITRSTQTAKRSGSSEPTGKSQWTRHWTTYMQHSGRTTPRDMNTTLLATLQSVPWRKLFPVKCAASASDVLLTFGGFHANSQIDRCGSDC